MGCRKGCVRGDDALPKAASVANAVPRTAATGILAQTFFFALMLIQELNRDECRDVLGRSSLGRLACARFDQPYVVPIHYSFDSERNCIYAFSAIGQKILWMRENQKVCLEVEEISDKDHWTTVLAFGRYEEIHQNPEDAELRRRAEQLFVQRREWWLPAAGKVEGREHPDVVVYRIQIDRLTGRHATRG